MGVRDDLQALPQRLRELHQDALAFQAVVAVLLLVVGMMGVTRPLTRSLHDRVEELHQLEMLAEVCSDLEHSLAVWDLVEPHLAFAADPVEWGKWLSSEVEASGLVLLKQDPPRVDELGELTTLRFSLGAAGTWPQIVELARRLESSDRLVRLDRVSITPGEQALRFELEVVGLCGGEELRAVMRSERSAGPPSDAAFPGPPQEVGP